MTFRRGAAPLILILTGFILIGCRSQPTTAQVDDAAITKGVKARLAAEFGAIERREARQMERGADQQVVNYIDVSSSNGMVTLSGEVRGNRAKTKAEQIAKSAPHVSGVVNQLGVAPGYSDDAVGTGTR